MSLVSKLKGVRKAREAPRTEEPTVEDVVKHGMGYLIETQTDTSGANLDEDLDTALTTLAYLPSIIFGVYSTIFAIAGDIENMFIFGMGSTGCAGFIKLNTWCANRLYNRYNE